MEFQIVQIIVDRNSSLRRNWIDDYFTINNSSFFPWQSFPTVTRLWHERYPRLPNEMTPQWLVSYRISDFRWDCFFWGRYTESRPGYSGSLRRRMLNCQWVIAREQWIDFVRLWNCLYEYPNDLRWLTESIVFEDFTSIAYRSLPLCCSLKLWSLWQWKWQWQWHLAVIGIDSKCWTDNPSEFVDDCEQFKAPLQNVLLHDRDNYNSPSLSRIHDLNVRGFWLLRLAVITADHLPVRLFLL
jgi:hypothetical protein